MGDRPLIAARLKALADTLDHRVRTRLPERIRYLLSVARAKPTGLSGAYLWGVPEMYSALPFGTGYLILDRCGRGPLLQSWLAWHLGIQAAADLRGMVEMIRPVQWAAMRESLNDILPSRLLSARVGAWSTDLTAVRYILHMHLLAADLLGDPWPEDPCAPPGTPLHRVERDGVLLGAWGVGIDGVPNGGLRYHDWCMSLGPPLGKPNMTDPPPAIP